MFLCLLFAMRSRLFIAAFLSPAWEVAVLLALVGGVCCIFNTFPCGIQGRCGT